MGARVLWKRMVKDMDLEAALERGEHSIRIKKRKAAMLPRLSDFVLAYQSLGIVYGDLSTSPLYVLRSTFTGLLPNPTVDDVRTYGVLSLVFWTLTLVTLFKYVFFVLSANDNGEGGTFALYSLLCRYANLGVLPGKQVQDEDVSTYYNRRLSETETSRRIREFFEKHHRPRVILLLVALLGTCMVIGDGVLTPAISILSAVEGLKVKVHGLQNEYILLISCVILMVVFALQHLGTRNVGFLFAPVVILWLLCVSGIGVYNIVKWNKDVFKALSPHHIYYFFKNSGRSAWEALGGIVLCITGAEAMFADLGHFSQYSIKIAFTGLVYPCLILAYMGEVAYLTKNPQDIVRGYYSTIPESVFWPVFLVATFAAIVGSQAVISGTFSIIYQCSALSCFPRVKVVHTSGQIRGQIYIPEVNWMLMCLCLAVILGFQDTIIIGHAYGLAVTSVMFVTTCLMFLVIIIVWQKGIILAASFLIFFGSIELLYISACLVKAPEGGWVPLLLSFIFMLVMYIWHYGTKKKYEFDLQNKVSLEKIMELGPDLGIVRVPGIGLIYTELATGIPPIFGHFVTNLPAFHQIVVFVCVKAVQVSHVPIEERFLIGRVGPKEFRMYRCVVRYGYKDLHSEDRDFEEHLVLYIGEFIEKENKGKNNSSNNGGAYDMFGEKMAVINTQGDSRMKLIVSNSPDQNSNGRLPDSGRGAISVLDTFPDKKQKKKVRFEITRSPEMDSEVKKEIRALVEAKEAGVSYIIGHSHVEAKESGFILKRIAINVIYDFLRRNCRDPSASLSIPHISLIEVGMIYRV